MRFLFLITMLVLLPLQAHAEGVLPQGTRINLSATAETELANDEVVIHFQVDKEAADANAVRQHINKVSAAIHKRLGMEKGVKLKTLSRNMQPVWKYPKNSPRARTGWRMVQSEQVTSMDLDGLPKWLDAIEAEGAHLSSLQFRINDNTSRQEQERLRLGAIAEFRDKAKEITRGLSARSFRIISLNSSSHAPQPVLYRAEMAMAARASVESSPPSLSAGEGKLSISVNGEIEVPFTDFSAQ